MTRLPPQPIPAPEDCFLNELSLDFGWPKNTPFHTAADPEGVMDPEEGLWEWPAAVEVAETTGTLYRRNGAAWDTDE